MTKTASDLAKVVLITGASSGIGEATARHLAAAGHRVVLGARRTDRIAALADQIRDAGGEALAQPLDVTDLASMEAFAAAARARYGRIDVLVNNAGVMSVAPLDALRIDDWNRMIDVNLRGVLHGVAAVLPTMRQQGVGHVITLASTSAYQVGPATVVYSATKHAVRALSEGLRQESRHIRVTLVSPGLTRTELFDGVTEPQIRTMIDGLLAQASIPAAAIAEAIGYAIRQPDDVDVNELIVRPTAQT
jgi:NADP-dependent 3-hydroxy acid dehydrogenase YdfG